VLGGGVSAFLSCGSFAIVTSNLFLNLYACAIIYVKLSQSSSTAIIRQTSALSQANFGRFSKFCEHSVLQKLCLSLLAGEFAFEGQISGAAKQRKSDLFAANRRCVAVI